MRPPHTKKTTTLNNNINAKHTKTNATTESTKDQSHKHKLISQRKVEIL